MTGTGGDVLAKTRRFSRPRELVRATLDDSDVFLTAQGVHAEPTNRRTSPTDA